MPKLSDSLNKATAVLCLVNTLEREEFSHHFWVEGFVNGREQGYCIRALNYSISFGRNKTSDHVVVYHSRSGEIFVPNNIPKNDMDWNGEYFMEVDRAAHYIINLMKAHAARLDSSFAKEEQESQENYNKIPSDNVDNYLPADKEN